MSNKKIGNDFEKELAEYLFAEGYWVHLLTQNKHGQPADLIAINKHEILLIDCKTCSTDRFSKNRIEENQISSMKLVQQRTKVKCLFAILYKDDIYMIPFNDLLKISTKTIKFTEDYKPIQQSNLQKYIATNMYSKQSIKGTSQALAIVLQTTKSNIQNCIKYGKLLRNTYIIKEIEKQ